MPSLILELDNMTNLPDGGPTSFTVLGSRSVDIGRDTYLDWTLPDPNRVVSGRHCEIRYRDGGYVLTDRSTNGTYLNGSEHRLTEPTRLKTGDVIDVGPYIIKVTVHEDEGAAPSAPSDSGSAFAEAGGTAMWDASGAAPPAPVTEPKRGHRGTPVLGDALDWRMDIPAVEPAPPAPPPAGPSAGPGAPWAPPQPTPPANVWDAAPPAASDAPAPQVPGAWDAPEPQPGAWDAPPPPSSPAADAWAEPVAAPAPSPEPAAWGEPRPSPDSEPAPPPAAWGEPAEAASPPADEVLQEAPAWEPAAVPKPAAMPEPAAHAEPESGGDDADWEIPRPEEFEHDGATTTASEEASAAQAFAEPEPAAAPEVPAPQPLVPAEPVPPQPFVPAEPHAGADARLPREPGHGQPFAVAGSGGPHVSPFAPPPPRQEGEIPAAPAPAASADYERFLEALSGQIGVPADILRAEGPEAVAERVGRFMVHSVAGLHALLKARATSRGFLRSDRGTTVEAVGNNPLKFLPTPEDVLRVLMGPPTRTYLNMDDALDQSYQDVSTHQVATYTAMQEAVRRMLDDLGPDAVERAAGDEGGGGSLGRMMGGGSSRKARLWDAFKERWTARAAPYDNGMVDVFMMHFGEAYGRAMRKKP